MQEGMDVTGIVLQSAPFGEADRRITLLTKEFGKISAFVRGARRPTSTMVGLTRPFAFGTFTVFPGKSAYSATKADIQEYFEELTKDVSKSAYGCYFLDLTAYFTHEGTPAKEELLLLYFALKALAKTDIPAKLIQLIFELRLLKIQGLVPSFKTCSLCERPIIEAVFDTRMMTPVCMDCKKDGSFELPLRKSALYALNFIEETEVNKLFSFTVTEDTFSEMKNVISFLLQQNLDREIPSLEMLHVLTSD